MKISKLKNIIRETLEEQAHWWGYSGSGYNPPVDENGQIIPGDWIYYQGECEDCSQGQPISYECYNPNSPVLYSSLSSCQSDNTTAVSGCTDPLATNYDSSATQDDGSCILPCVQSDFAYSSTCGQQHLGPAPGGKNSWNPWINTQWGQFQQVSVGCYHLGAIINYSSNQITPTINCPVIWNGYGGARNNGTCHGLIAVKRKYAKMNWAQCLKTGPCSNNDAPGCASWVGDHQTGN